jgi:hypothetical protein
MPQALRLPAAVLLGAFLFAPQGPLRAGDDETDRAEPPAAGRPEDFSQVVGAYRISSRATPTELCAEDPLLLTVVITGSGPAAYQPRRQHLRLFPASLARDFFIKPLPAKDRHMVPAKTWEFSYELRPKRAGVARVPALRLVYYDPAYKKYQTSYAAAVPLTVKPRSEARPPVGPVQVLQAPDAGYELSSGAEVLRRAGSDWPGVPALLALLVTPPAACALWYALWRRRHPDAARLAQRRRSQAADQTLKALRRLEGHDASGVAALLARYLRHRLDLPAAAPTPAEVSRHLRRLGVPSMLARRTADLLSACDAARFAPVLPAGAADLAGAAAQLIRALESEPGPPGRQPALVTHPHPAQRRPHSRAISALLLALLLAAPASSLAQDSDEQVLARAEAAFRQGVQVRARPAEARSHFAAAAEAYHELHTRGLASAALYRNEAQAALLAGWLAQAIRAYRLGLDLAPEDLSLQEGLEYARDQVNYPPGARTRPPAPSWPAWLPWPTPLTHLALAFAAYTLTCAVATRWLMTRRASLAAVAAAAGVAALVLGGAWMVRQREQASMSRHPLVVVAADGAALRTGNGSSYPRHDELPGLARGMEARQLFRRGDWLQIEIPGGATGWVRRADVLAEQP